MERKHRIRDAFSAAAAAYDAAAGAQDRAAGLVADALPAPGTTARVLELGCGTGLLTRRLLERLGPDARILATDISPAMIERAGAALADPRLSLAVMDAEHPAALAGGFDLVVSSLAAQWFSDLGETLRGLAGLLAPGGRMVIATLGSRTFMEWRAVHAALGLESGVPDYPGTQELAALLPGSRVAEAAFTMAHDDARAFLKSLDAMGAATPRPGHRPLSAGALRRAMAAMGSPCTLTWDILILSFTKQAVRS